MYLLWTTIVMADNMKSVRSRDGRRNRAPPPRVRYNKDGKKVNPQQAARPAAAGAVA